MRSLNRLFMQAAYHGYQIMPSSIKCSQTPTSRELVNLVGAGFEILQIKKPDSIEEEQSFEVLSLIKNQAALEIQA